MVSRDLYQFRHVLMEAGKPNKVDYWDTYFLDEDVCKVRLTNWVREFEKHNPQVLSNLKIGYGEGWAYAVYYREGKRYEERLSYGPYRIYMDEEIFHG